MWPDASPLPSLALNLLSVKWGSLANVLNKALGQSCPVEAQPYPGLRINQRISIQPHELLKYLTNYPTGGSYLPELPRSPPIILAPPASNSYKLETKSVRTWHSQGSPQLLILIECFPVICLKKKNLLLFKPFSLWCFVIAAWADWDWRVMWPIPINGLWVEMSLISAFICLIAGVTPFKALLPASGIQAATMSLTLTENVTWSRNKPSLF